MGLNIPAEEPEAMPQSDAWITMVVGGVFLLLGVLALVWGRQEEKRLLESLARKRDLREFTASHLENPQPGALKIGGWLSIALGALLVIIGLILWLI
jgi:hypothetical protein